jgi:hypothetical protein
MSIIAIQSTAVKKDGVLREMAACHPQFLRKQPYFMGA